MTTYRDLRPWDVLDNWFSTAIVLSNDGTTLRYVYLRKQGRGMLVPIELDIRDLGGRNLEGHWMIVRARFLARSR